MKISTRGISKCGVLACLTYVMWYKWVYGEQSLILYAAAAIAIGSMVLGLFFEDIPLSKVFPLNCIKEILMCVYSLMTGIFIATSQSVLLSTILTYLSFSLVCLAACYASSKHGFDWLLKGIICIALLCAVWTLTRGYYRVGYGMVLGPTNNPHTLGFAMNLAIFAVAYRSKATVKSFALNLPLVALFLYIIAQCGSRKCLLAAVFILIPWLWSEAGSIYKRGKSSQKLIITLLIVAIVIGVAYFFGNVYITSDSYARMENMGESEANEARLTYFGMGFEFFFKSPLFGIGLGQFAVLNPDATYSHSVIPEAIASWGIIGSLLYFLPMIIISFRALSYARLKRDKESIVIVSLCAMEYFMAFVQIYFYSLPHMITWTIIALFVDISVTKNQFTEDR